MYHSIGKYFISQLIGADMVWLIQRRIASRPPIVP